MHCALWVKYRSSSFRRVGSGTRSARRRPSSRGWRRVRFGHRQPAVLCRVPRGASRSLRAGIYARFARSRSAIVRARSRSRVSLQTRYSFTRDKTRSTCGNGLIDIEIPQYGTFRASAIGILYGNDSQPGQPHRFRIRWIERERFESRNGGPDLTAGHVLWGDEDGYGR